jgi:hypothetical protein
MNLFDLTMKNYELLITLAKIFGDSIKFIIATH